MVGVESKLIWWQDHNWAVSPSEIRRFLQISKFLSFFVSSFTHDYEQKLVANRKHSVAGTKKEGGGRGG